MEAFFSDISPALIWFLVGLILVVGEFVVPGLIVIFFGIGAWLTAALCMVLDVPLAVQLAVFLVGSIACLVVLRRRFQKLFKGLVRHQNPDGSDSSELIGEQGVVCAPIGPGGPGKVELRGTTWNAEADVELETGKRVEVVKTRGLTLMVKKAQ